MAIEIPESIKFTVGAIGLTALAVGAFGILVRYTDPYRNKPIPSLKEVKANFKKLAIEDKSQKFKVHLISHDDCPFEDIETVPEIVYGNSYRAIVELDKYLRNVYDFSLISHLRHLAADSWEVEKNTFIEEMVRIFFLKGCFYLTDISDSKIL